MEDKSEPDMKIALKDNLESLKESFRETPSMEYLLQIVATYHGLEMTERGIGFAEAILMQIEDEKEKLLQTSMIFEMVDLNDDALSCLTEAMDKYPEDVQVKNHHGMLLNKSSKFEDALSIYEGLLEASPESLESLSGKLIALIGIGRHGDVLKLYKTSIGITPSSPQDWHFKGVIDGLLMDYFEHEKGKSITEGQADKLSKSFDSISHIMDGLGAEVSNFYMMGNFAGKEIYHEMLENKK
jgi:tetratricopeptide (TPR) repeat protein